MYYHDSPTTSEKNSSADSTLLNPTSNLESNKNLINNNSSDSQNESQQHKMSKCPIRKLEPFAYFIVFSLFLNTMVTLGAARSLVIFFLPFREYYDLSYKGTASFIAVYMTMGGIAAMMIAKLCRKFGARPICVVCSLTGTAAWVMASSYVGPRTQNQEGGHKYLLLALAVAGFCHGGVLVNAPVEVNRWWPKTKRSIVNAIVWSGSSFGAIVYPICYNGFIKMIEEKRAESNDLDSSQDWLKAMFYMTIIQGVIMFGTCLTLKNPKYDYAKEEANIANQGKSQEEQEVTFKGLFKFKLYKVYILAQVFYGFWRSGATTWLAAYAEGSKGFEREDAVMLLTYWATAELITRPIVGRLAKSFNRYSVLGILFFFQALATYTLVKVNNTTYFTFLVICMGCIQGGAGGLFMTAAIDAVGAIRARYAFSVENTIDIFVAACVVHLYGRMVDKSDEKEWKNPNDKVFLYASCFILISSLISFYGSRLRQFSESHEDDDCTAKKSRSGFNQDESQSRIFFKKQPNQVQSPDRNNETNLFIIDQNCGFGDAPFINSKRENDPETIMQLDFSKCPYLKNNASSAKSVNDYIEEVRR